ncbi:MAG TPA: hypothetical protein VH207_16580 [Chthoniobacterales bacterium]|jgi:hypothetical protein|nr:hypothetical protein [Chthoniobacterales bacterium]
MLETPIRSWPWGPGLTIVLFSLTLLFSSCATEQPRTALISDPDAQSESSIPWNRPQKWETGANIPGGLGGGAADASGQAGTGGY